MKLEDVPGKRNTVPNRGAIASLPPDILQQVVEAVANDTHSTKAIGEWLRSEGFTNATDGALDYWIGLPGSPSRGCGLAGS